MLRKLAEFQKNAHGAVFFTFFCNFIKITLHSGCLPGYMPTFYEELFLEHVHTLNSAVPKQRNKYPKIKCCSGWIRI